MGRRKKQKIHIDNPLSLQGLLQEVYNDAYRQILDAQKTINELTKSVKIEDIDDATKIAKEKTSAQKIKDSGIRIKLEVGRLLKDVMKNKGDVNETINQISGKEDLKEGFKAVREMIKDAGKDKDESEE